MKSRNRKSETNKREKIKIIGSNFPTFCKSYYIKKWGAWTFGQIAVLYI
jgi:hypothetical protein